MGGLPGLCPNLLDCLGLRLGKNLAVRANKLLKRGPRTKGGKP